MNHFEELGLSRSATNREIQSAYKTLAWLLHPDRQQTEKHREMAEIQMRRLNESMSVLLNAESRKAYEAQLDLKARPSPPNIVVVAPHVPERELWFRRIDARSVFLFVVGMAFATILWHAFSPNRGGLPLPTTTSAAAIAPADADLRGRVQDLEGRLNEMLREARPAGARRSRAPVSAEFPGTWSYDFLPQQNAAVAVGPIKRVYLAIVDDHGTLRGTYSSQGNPLAGQPLNAVAFQFAGKATGAQARLPWGASGGASGEIEIRLLGPDMLETKWWAYSTGTGLPETSGTAVLRRQTGQ